MAFNQNLRKFIKIFLDNFCVYGPCKDHEQPLALCFKKCHAFGISLNVVKCQLLVTNGKLLGHIMSIHGITPNPNSFFLIVNIPRPQIVTQVHSFVNLGGYCERMVACYSNIVASLKALLKKMEVEANPIWTLECEEAFLTLKDKLLILSSINST